MQPNNKLIAIPAVVVGISIAVALLWGVWYLALVMLAGPPTGRAAIYEGMAFSINGGEYSIFSTGNDGDDIAEVYLRPTGGTESYLLPTLKESDVLELWPEAETQMIAGQKVYSPGNLSSSFAFHNGRLVACTLSAVSISVRNKIEIGKASKGEFISLPARPDDVYRVFGRPLRYETFMKPRT